MQYRHDARSGNDISVLGFGCMRFPKEQEAERLILRALDQGVNYFDTAYAYSGSEEILGRVMEKHGIRDRMLIATKLPHGKVRAPEDIEKLFATSLGRMKIDYVDYYLIHNIVTFDQWEHLLELGIEEWIAKAKEQGRIRQIGFSFHGALPEFKRMMDAYDWDFVQIQYNYVNEHYQAGREGLDLAAERGLPVIIMEPLLGGKLATGLPKAAEAELKAVHPDASCASWGFRWLWDQPNVTCVLSGMNASEQLEDNLANAASAVPGCMTDEEREALNRAKAAFEASYKIPCTGCNYCMPCAAKINIPAAFAAYNESYALKWFDGFFHHMVSVGINSGSPRFLMDCTNCGACVRKCPQHIDIPKELLNVRKRLEPSIVKPASKVFTAFMNR